MRLRDLWAVPAAAEGGVDGHELRRMHADAGMPGGAPTRTNPNSDRDATRMAAHFGADLDAAPPNWLGAVRDVERTCACCTTVERCHRWFAEQAGNDSPRLFCPNAETFDLLAAEQRDHLAHKR